MGNDRCSLCTEDAVPMDFISPTLGVGRTGNTPVSTRATVCRACGHIDLYATDPVAATSEPKDPRLGR